MAYIQLDKGNFFHNLNQFALKIGSKEKIAIVLKDNAYGHNLQLMAKLASKFGLTKAVVRTVNEANEIRNYFHEIIILGDRGVADPKLSFALNSLEDILRAERGSGVELKVDTGMHRNGISINELEMALKLIEQRGLNLKGVMSHNRSADELSSELFWQNKNFEHVKRKVKDLGFKGVRFHSFNSASTLRMESQNEDLIRLGIGAYGYNELPKVYGDSIKLKPVLSLWANRVSTRKLKKGARVGYGGSFITPKDMVVSTYDLGYGDGWMRSNSFKPFITAEGLPILGRVSMDYISLESTKDKVCIFNNAKYAGEQLGTIPYEILTQLSNRLEAFS